MNNKIFYIRETSKGANGFYIHFPIGALKIDQHPKFDNGLKDKELRASVAFQREEASNERFNRDMDFMERRTSQPDTLPKIVLDSSTESYSGDKLNLGSLKNAVESPTGAVVHSSSSKPPVNGQIEKMDVGFSCNDQKLTDLYRCVSMTVADLQSVKDNVIGVGVDDTKPVKNEACDADNGFSCKVQNENIAKINSSFLKDDRPSGKGKEFGQYSEDSGLSHSKVMKFFDEECHSEVQNLNQLEQKCEDESEILHQIGHPNEESNQMTPPDTEIFDKQDMEENRVHRGEYVLHNKDDLSGSLSGTNNRNAMLDDSKKYKVVS